MDHTMHDAAVAEMNPRLLYDVLRLRVDVFVVEQSCAYPELDGRDVEPGARLVWAADAAGRVVATLRMLSELDGSVRIGRVATAADARGGGMARRLVTRALELAGDATTVLDAQSHLREWYAGLGYVQDGEEFVEDGIAHVPMRRPGRPA